MWVSVAAWPRHQDLERLAIIWLTVAVLHQSRRWGQCRGCCGQPATWLITTVVQPQCYQLDFTSGARYKAGKYPQDPSTRQLMHLAVRPVTAGLRCILVELACK